MTFLARVKSILRPRLTAATAVGLAFGAVVGYLSVSQHWGLSFIAAMGMVLGCAYGVEIISSVVAAQLNPRFERYPRDKKVALMMSSSIATHVLAWFLMIWVAGLILNFSIFQAGILFWFSVYAVVLVIGSVLRQLASFRRELRQKDLAEERLKALTNQAELKALKAQINPHFLFNSLNTIASLTSTDPSKAEDATLKLADIFRYTLSSSNKEFVALKDELDFLDSYLDVEKARFGNRLKISKTVQPETLNTRIPSLILQPLVENCLKHGQCSDGSAVIAIRCFVEGRDVKIEISDNGRGMPEAIKKGQYTGGTGLKNVNERLIKMFGEPYQLRFMDNQPSGAMALVTIPREA